MSILRSILLALALAPAVALAAEPITTTPANPVFEAAIATPRLYVVAASGAMKGEDGVKLCFGGDYLRKMAANLQQLGSDPAVIKELTKGCTEHAERKDGQVFLAQVCDEAAGAPITMRGTLSGTMDHLRQHSEFTLKADGPGGRAVQLIGDTEMTYAGPCPANLKPGQVQMPDGRITDLSTGLPARAK